MVYTMIDLITQNRGVMKSAFELMQKATYDKSSAMLWFYFLVIGGLMALIMLIYNQLCLKRWS